MKLTEKQFDALVQFALQWMRHEWSTNPMLQGRKYMSEETEHSSAVLCAGFAAQILNSIEHLVTQSEEQRKVQ